MPVLVWRRKAGRAGWLACPAMCRVLAEGPREHADTIREQRVEAAKERGRK